MKKNTHFHLICTAQDPLTLIEFLSAKIPSFSKTLLKKVIDAGGVWKKIPPAKNGQRIRKVTSPLKKGDVIDLYYDPKVIEQKPLTPIPILERSDYGIWYKPSGMLSQGTLYGDHTSILRLVEKGKKEVFLVHRLDREVSGLILIAYNKNAARLFSQLWQKKGLVKKFYQARVLGDLLPSQTLESVDGSSGEIKLPLDGQEAHTLYKTLQFDQQQNSSLVQIQILTGRFHQIRRHFEKIGHPVVGDPMYGKNNKNKEGMKLCAFHLQFPDPFTKEMIDCQLPQDLMPF